MRDRKTEFWVVLCFFIFMFFQKNSPLYLIPHVVFILILNTFLFFSCFLFSLRLVKSPKFNEFYLGISGLIVIPIQYTATQIFAIKDSENIPIYSEVSYKISDILHVGVLSLFFGYVVILLYRKWNDERKNV